MRVHPLFVIILNFLVLGSLYSSSALVGESFSQVPPSDLTSKFPKAFESIEMWGSPVPFADFGERLRRSSHWQELTPEEQAQVLGEIERTSQSFLDRQPQMNIQCCEEKA